MRILLVDDDNVFTDLLVSSLSDHGVKDVVVAHSAREALGFVKTAVRPFECFLLDIMMEKMDGIQLCAELRQRNEYRAAPIIMLTSSPTKHHMTRAFEAGATDFLRKPLDVVEMVGRINTAMMLVEATKKEIRGRMALRAVIKYAKEFNLIDLRERVCFREIKGMVDYYQIENELLRLDPVSLNVNLSIVRMRNFNDIFQGKDRGYVVQILHEISTTISHALAAMDFRFSYVGYGKFEIIQYHEQPEDGYAIEGKLTKQLAQTLANLSFVWPENLEIDVSTISQRRSMTREEVLQSLHLEFENAGRQESFLLPEIKLIEKQLFDHIKKIEKEFATR